MSSIRRRLRLFVDVNTTLPSRNSWGSFSVSTRFAAIRSLRSMNFPDVICCTSLCGTGENPGPTTNGWSSSVAVELRGASEADTDVPKDEASELTGNDEAKVLTKVGTTTDLPSVPDAIGVNGIPARAGPPAEAKLAALA